MGNPSPPPSLKRRPIIGPSPSPSPSPAPTPSSTRTDDRTNGSADVAAPSLSSSPEPRGAAYLGLMMAAFVTFCYLFYVARVEKKRDAETLWLPQELGLYSGSDDSKGLLLSITGLVFDVTKGEKHYGKGKSYNHFCGRDATRAFVSGKFSGEGLTDDVKDMTDEELKSLDGWREFYYKTYPHVGKLVGRFYDPSGKPTKTLLVLLKKIQKAKETLKGLEEEDGKVRGCNSKWTEGEGGEVWCDSGYPRKVFKAGSPKSGPNVRLRCGCFYEGELDRPDQQLYPNCGSRDERCKTS